MISEIILSSGEVSNEGRDEEVAKEDEGEERQEKGGKGESET